ncbi:Strong similarity to Arabidopsis receptor-like kinase (gb/ATLECGENE) and F20P5.15 [Arabidopsis thaliana]|uniref:Putative L-type lectin-domain containing receptor kinase V.1 n=1 Tax=Arabidopsis thaliana TaxID=3702 RepID=LRK51_ARATH|nr:Concanavalin A-like lectin protein kinase family protein [Arabidopsis thaliana]O04534.1 RecName: Full=Putative L-type lectin-domain containing receptor kinase V.1; Short=Arabidopsis thaliana lectin-receptor kinase b2; Short=AthlecRK-b2; Short=LecRK-V.1; Flags: Precursor [Arabidopsis thaliana]AAB61103.1 Strong similarity to Arabidopsis receptor-like kinase (gb/ATLECGENE) and F20P5.15 [Arabidopsis thaliana]AEE35021.1 Concanavalin A-like lectin protein kinase family protein [Arabidopsis thaliana|eukprot:NP_177168.1 Concanavalin A-like lectin protein kinase family protein [Arabidopsis thaliana]
MVLLLFLVLFFVPESVVCQRPNPNGVEFNTSGNMYTSGSAYINNNGLIRLTNSTPQTTGQVFYNDQLRFKNSVNGTVSSFSTTFVFSIEFHNGIYGGYGIAFVICPTRDLSPTFPTTYLGLFNRSNMGDPKNHIVAVELDTKVDQQFEDKDANHVGIDINTLVSDTVALAGYYMDNGTFRSLLLNSGQPMQIWIEYDSKQKQINVTLHPLYVPKPKIPLLSLEKDLSPYLLELMYVGFTSTTGDLTASHYILGWTFKMNGTTPDIDPSRLPKIPRYNQPWIQSPNGILTISLTVSGVIILIILSLSLWLFLKRKKLLEVLEDWEVQFGPHRFAFKDLHIATKGFKDTEVLGKGGFGKVYKGTLPVSNVEIAVKMVSHDSRQGMREFIAEIATIGRLRHPNLVRLQGYCRHKGELYLVYDCMAKGSLDKFLYHQQTGNLDWSQRFKIIKDVASGLYYLHQQWVQVIIHRDIKPANILLDANMNAKLGDFGLAKLCDHGTDPQTSHVAGTLGYISPELSRTGKASTRSDVFAFGIVMLEIACGRKPILPRASQREMVLTDWVLECWENEDIMQVLDHKIGQEYVEEQAALVLKLGLFCSHPVAAIRPNMSSVIQLLDSVAQLPHNLLDIVQTREVHRGTEISGEAADSPESCSIAPLTFTESFVSHGR